MTAKESTEQGVREAVAAAIGKADAAFGYSFNLTRLVDGVSTYTLAMPGFDPIDFEDRDDGYRLVEERRNNLRADAILATLSPDDIRREERERCAVLCDVAAGRAREAALTAGDREVAFLNEKSCAQYEATARAIRSQPSREGEK